VESTRPASASVQPKPLSGLHLLLTYECNYECDHCFVWGGPSQSGTMTAETIEHILKQADELGTIEWIYFEGGEPFLYYERLCSGVRLAKESGFRVGIVSNAYWAKSEKEALAMMITTVASSYHAPRILPDRPLSSWVSRSVSSVLPGLKRQMHKQ